jgi:hypothetical protein
MCYNLNNDQIRKQLQNFTSVLRDSLLISSLGPHQSFKSIHSDDSTDPRIVPGKWTIDILIAILPKDNIFGPIFIDILIGYEKHNGSVRIILLFKIYYH